MRNLNYLFAFLLLIGLSTTAQEAEQITWEKDNSQMVLIPAGSFEMGDHFNEGKADGRELPVHRVTLDGFYMDKTEVTVGQFKAFLADSDYSWGGSWDDVDQYSPSDDHPMIYVTWHDATAYAKWVGKRLPTEAEWEFAARGGLVGKEFPWGDDEAVVRDYANYKGTDGKDKWGRTTAPVGSFKPNDYGLFDMSGNVWEWCQDWYSEDKIFRDLRGGSWYYGLGSLRAAGRGSLNPGGYLPQFNGFRCVSGLNKNIGNDNEKN